MDSAPSLADGDRYSQGAKCLNGVVPARPAVPTAIQRGWRIECCRRTGALIRAAAPAELSSVLNIEVASPFQYFGDQCCIEYVGQLSPKGLGHYMVNVSAISPNSLPRLPEPWGQPGSRGQQPAHKSAATAATGLRRLFLFFCFWKKSPLLLPGWAFCAVSVCWRGRRSRWPRTAGPGGAAGEASTQNERQRRQRVFVDSSCVFLSWRGLRKPVAFVAWASTLCADKASRNQCQRSGNGQRRCERWETVGAAAEAPASPHQCRGATAGAAVRPSSADRVRLGGAVELTAICCLPGGRQSLFVGMAEPGAHRSCLTPNRSGPRSSPPGWCNSIAISTAKMSMPSTTGWPAKTIPRATVSPSTRPRASSKLKLRVKPTRTPYPYWNSPILP